MSTPPWQGILNENTDFFFYYCKTFPSVVLVVLVCKQYPVVVSGDDHQVFICKTDILQYCYFLSFFCLK